MAVSGIVDRCCAVLFVLFSVFTLLSVILGIYALSSSYVLQTERELINSYNIFEISGTKLSEDIFWTFPEFFRRSSEEEWWHRHREIYQILRIHERSKKAVVVREKGRISDAFPAFVSKPAPLNIFKKTAIFYVVALVWLLSAWLIRRKYPEDKAGKVLSVFLSSGSLYIASMAPLAERFITLPPVEFRLLIMLNYLAGGGFISIVHFALIFPRQKEVITKYPWLETVFYLYLFITTAAYFAGITAFDSSMPFFIMWSLIFFTAISGSIRTEENIFIKRQLQLILSAPLIMAGIFVFMHVIPQLLGVELMEPQFFACASLVLPFAVPLSMDNTRLYNTSMELREQIEREYKELRREIHDSTLREFILINKKLENIGNKLEKGRASEAIYEICHLNRKISITSSNLRLLMKFSEGAAGTAWNTWDDYIADLRYHIRRMAEYFNLDISIRELFVNPDDEAQGSIPLKVKLNLFRILSEAVANIIFHSGADKAEVLFRKDAGYLTVEVRDNGAGFPDDVTKKGHYGIRNMSYWALEMGADLQMYNLKEGGACVKIAVPVGRRGKTYEGFEILQNSNSRRRH